MRINSRPFPGLAHWTDLKGLSAGIQSRLDPCPQRTNELVSWSLTSPFNTNITISETKRSEVESYPYPVKKGQRYINLNPGRLFVQQPPKRERDREAHLNYYASAYNRERRLSHHKTIINQIQQNTREQILTKQYR